MDPDCLICRELRGNIAIPGGLIWQDEAAAAFHAPPLEEQRIPRPYLGHLMVVTRRHVGRLGDLDDAEAASVGRISARLARALTNAAGADWVYSAVIGTGEPHFHLHLLPRYPGTPPEVAWYAVDEWEGGRHGAAQEVAEFIDGLRSALGTNAVE
jgi:diadenosine tetraphosphate (Ap4A) HIT family hydrolase